MVSGHFLQKGCECPTCGATWAVYEEKETDVNIAVGLAEDAVQNRFDTALLVSADSDLCPAISSMKRLCPDKRIVAVFPPRRHSVKLARTADNVVYIGDDKLRRSQLPPVVVTDAGVWLERPKYWS